MLSFPLFSIYCNLFCWSVIDVCASAESLLSRERRPRERFSQEVTLIMRLQEHLLVVLFMSYSGALAPSESTIQQLFWQVFISHAHHIVCPSDWSLLEELVQAWIAGFCKNIPVRPVFNHYAWTCTSDTLSWGLTHESFVPCHFDMCDLIQEFLQ